MEKKFTGGEWRIGNGEVFRPASSGSISPYYKQICSFVNTGNDESKANAALISAAPDLLEVLTDIQTIQALHYGDGMATHLALAAQVDRINAAITKALTINL